MIAAVVVLQVLMNLIVIQKGKKKMPADVRKKSYEFKSAGCSSTTKNKGGTNYSSDSESLLQKRLHTFEVFHSNYLFAYTKKTELINYNIK